MTVNMETASEALTSNITPRRHLLDRHGVVDTFDMWGLLKAESLKTPETRLLTGKDLQQALKIGWVRRDAELLGEILTHSNLTPRSQVSAARAIVNTWESKTPSRIYPCIDDPDVALYLLDFLAVNPSLTYVIVELMLDAGIPVEQFAHHKAVDEEALEHIIWDIVNYMYYGNFLSCITKRASLNPNLTDLQAKTLINFVDDYVMAPYLTPADFSNLKHFINETWTFKALVPEGLKSRFLVGAASV
jgi:hypothetical protein